MFVVEKSSGNLLVKQAIILAPMEEVTDLSYRLLCKELGAEMLYTEFINSDGLVRGVRGGYEKMRFLPEERPLGIQIYGNDVGAMVGSCQIAEASEPDLIDINAGCWVKKVSKRGAGAGLLCNPGFMESMIGAVVKAVQLPVTVKTRIGWDRESLNIVEIAKRLEGVGVKGLTIHCRTRQMGHSGAADWSWIDKVKAAVEIPVVLNGGVMRAEDAVRAFKETGADGVMIARGAIGSPWIFREIRELLEYGKVRSEITLKTRVAFCLRHLRTSIALRGERIALPAFRKYYGRYLKGFYKIAKLRTTLMELMRYELIEEVLYAYLKDFESLLEENRTGKETI